MKRSNEMEPRLVYEPVPGFDRRPGAGGKVYKYVKYIPLVEEFLASGEESARVESDEPSLIGHVNNAIFHSSARMRVDACIRGGRVWLRRKQRQ